jgi:hypothetical protein
VSVSCQSSRTWQENKRLADAHDECSTPITPEKLRQKLPRGKPARLKSCRQHKASPQTKQNQVIEKQ